MKTSHSFVILAYNESDNLEECIKSIKNQSIKSNVLIATSTKNDFIIELASEYGLGVMVNESKSNKGNDYNFSLSAVDTKLVTIAHQDDLYDRNYTKEIIKCYRENKNASIIFTDYYEINKDEKIKYSKSLFKKHFLIHFLGYKKFNKKKYFKRLALKYQNSICTSSVTFNKKKIDNDFFPTELKYNNDWSAFEKLSLDNNSRFVYLNKKLLGYRLSDKDLNDEQINENILMYKRFWNTKLVDYYFKKIKNKTI